MSLYTVIQHFNFLYLLYRYINCSSISNDDNAGVRPDMNIKVVANVKA